MNVSRSKRITRGIRRVVAGTAICLAIATSMAPRSEALGDVVDMSVFCNSATHQLTSTFNTAIWNTDQTHVALRSRVYNYRTRTWTTWAAWGVFATNTRADAPTVTTTRSEWGFQYQYMLYSARARAWGPVTNLNPRIFEGTSAWTPIRYGAPAAYCVT